MGYRNDIQVLSIMKTWLRCAVRTEKETFAIRQDEIRFAYRRGTLRSTHLHYIYGIEKGEKRGATQNLITEVGFSIRPLR